MSELRDLIKNFIITIPFVTMLFIAYGSVDQQILNKSVTEKIQNAKAEKYEQTKKELNQLLAKSTEKEEQK